MLHFIPTTTLLHFLISYGYIAVLLLVLIESIGIPVPGETTLLLASISAGTTHQLSLPLVIGAAASGAIIGDSLGFWAGRIGGARLFYRYAHLLRLNESKLKLGLYLFQKHGGKVVFFGRFVTILRMWAAVLAGTHHMRWPRFLACNAAGGMLWATSYGLGGYLLGANVYRFTGPLGMILAILAALVMLATFFLLRHHEQHWVAVAERAFPGPLARYISHTVPEQHQDIQQKPSYESISTIGWIWAYDAYDASPLRLRGEEQGRDAGDVVAPDAITMKQVASGPVDNHAAKHLRVVRLKPLETSM